MTASSAGSMSLALAESLLHSLWQVTALATLACLAANTRAARSAEVRYWVYSSALVMMAVCLPATFFVLANRESNRLEPRLVAVVAPAEDVAHPAGQMPPVEPAGGIEETAKAVAHSEIQEPPTASVSDNGLRTAATTVRELLRAIAPHAAAIYLLGVLVMFLRLLLAVGGGGRLRAGSRTASGGQIEAILRRQAGRLRLRWTPLALYCERVATPVVIGILRPVILLPVALATNLAADEIEALLTHELAHIRRYDPLFNLLQRLLEAVLFFHPAAWYVSRKITLEREHCCDDLVLACGTRHLTYAQSLLRVAEFCRKRPIGTDVAMLAADGHRPSRLRARIERFLNGSQAPQVRLTRSGAIAFVALLLFVLVGTATVLRSDEQPSAAPAHAVGSDDPAAGRRIEAVGERSSEDDRRTPRSHIRSASYEGDLHAIPHAIYATWLPVFDKNAAEFGTLIAMAMDDKWLANEVEVSLSENKMTLDDTGIPESLFEKAKIGELWLDHGDRLVPARGSILAPVELPDIGPGNWDLIDRVQRMDLVEFENQIGATLRSGHGTQGVKVQEGERYAFVRADGQLFVIKIFECSPDLSGDPGVMLSFFRIARFTPAQLAQLKALIPAKPKLSAATPGKEPPGDEPLPTKEAPVEKPTRNASGPKFPVDRENSPTATSDTSKRTVLSGHIVLEDGTPATARGWLYSEGRSASGNGYVNNEGLCTDGFSIKVPAGTVWLKYFADGFAPTGIGPIEAKAEKTVDDLKLVLRPGFSSTLRITSEDGHPVSGAKLAALAVIGDSSNGPRFDKTTNQQGEFLFEHLAATPYTFLVEAPGHEPLSSDQLTLKPGETTTLSMVRSQPTTGVVLNADGTPAKGAKIRFRYEVIHNKAINRVNYGHFDVIATTNDAGRFMLDQLTSTSRYLFVVETADKARVVVGNLRAGQNDARIQVPKRRDLRVRIVGDLNQLSKSSGKPFVGIRQEISIAEKDLGYIDLIGDDIDVTPSDEGGLVEYPGLVAGTVRVTAAGQEQTVKVAEEGDTEVVFQIPKIGEIKVPAVGRPPKETTHRKEKFDGVSRFQVSRTAESAIWFRTDDRIHFVLYHRGFLQSGLSYTTYGNHVPELAKYGVPPIWRFRGNINILDSRKFSLAYVSKDPNTLVLDDKSFDLRQGRVIVLNAEGEPRQLAVEPPAAKEENLSILGRSIDAQVDTHSNATVAPSDEKRKLKVKPQPAKAVQVAEAPKDAPATTPAAEADKVPGKSEEKQQPAAVPNELAMTITLEDNAPDRIMVVLRDSYSRTIETWDNVAPGKVRLPLPPLESGHYTLVISANGYAVPYVGIVVSKQGAKPSTESVDLFRRRYVVLRYVANMQGERELKGPNTKEARVAISYGGVPDLNGDWLIRQVFEGKGSKSPVFSFHRFGNFGIATPPAGVSFDDIELAPPPGDFEARSVVAEKGMILLNHVVGNEPRDRRYAKILVEDITETPPQGLEIINFRRSKSAPTLKLLRL